MKRKATPQSSDVVKTVKSKGHARNPIRELDLSWVESVCVDASSVRRRAATHGKRRSVKKDWQAAWLLHAVKCIDLTTLAGDDTARKVKRLCGKAKNPVSGVVLKGLELEGFDIKTGAVCVYPAMVKHAVAALEGSNSKIRASFVCHTLCTQPTQLCASSARAASSPRRPSDSRTNTSASGACFAHEVSRVARLSLALTPKGRLQCLHPPTRTHFSQPQQEVTMLCLHRPTHAHSNAPPFPPSFSNSLSASTFTHPNSAPFTQSLSRPSPRASRTA